MKTKLALLSAIFLPLLSHGFLFPTNPAPVVKLAWNAGNFVGYNLYFGIGSRQYTNSTPTTETNISITLPTRGVLYYFAVTGIDANGLETDFSNEVLYMPPNPKTPPTLGPLVILTVQARPAASASQFADTEMSWTLDPIDRSQLFRLRIALQ